MSNTSLNHSPQQIKPNFEAQSEAKFLAEFSQFIQEDQKALDELRAAIKELATLTYGI